MSIFVVLIFAATVSSEDRNNIEVLVWVLAGIALAVYVINHAGRRGK